MLLHWKCRPYGRFPQFPARTNREADQSAGVGEFACRLTRRAVEVVKVEVRLICGLRRVGKSGGGGNLMRYHGSPRRRNSCGNGRGKNVLINEKGNKRWGGGWGKQLGGDK